MILTIVNRQQNLIERFIAVNSLKADGDMIEIDIGVAYSHRLIKYILDSEISLVKVTSIDPDRFVTDLAIHYYHDRCIVVINNNPRFSFALS